MKSKVLLYTYMALLIIAILFLAVYSVSTSPLYGYPHSLDSSVYQTIGCYWAQGMLPYVDLWDHKGPLIYFINTIGYCLTGNKFGVLFIQILSLFFTLVVIWKFLNNRFSINRTWCYLILFIVAYSSCYGSNSVEEYIMPFLVLSFCLQYRWIIQSSESDNNHPWLWAALYGFVLAFSLYTRLTNALGIMAGTGYIAVTLVLRKQWTCFFLNVIGFVGGFLLLALPFAIYFYLHGALYEMWYGTFLFNLEYIGNADRIITPKESMYSKISYICAYFLFTISLIRVIRRHYYIGGYLLLICLIPLFWLLNSNGYLGYSMQCLPYLVVALCDVNEMQDAQLGKHLLWNSLVSFSIMIVAIAFMLNYRSFSKGYHYTSEERDINAYGQLISKIPEKDHISFLACNIHPTIYLHYRLKPGCRYFCNQNFYCYNSPEMKGLMLEAVSQSHPKWVIVKNHDYGVLTDYLKNSYIVAYNMAIGDNVYELLRLNENSK